MSRMDELAELVEQGLRTQAQMDVRLRGLERTAERDQIFSMDFTGGQYELLRGHLMERIKEQFAFGENTLKGLVTVFKPDPQEPYTPILISFVLNGRKYNITKEIHELTFRVTPEKALNMLVKEVAGRITEVLTEHMYRESKKPGGEVPHGSVDNPPDVRRILGPDQNEVSGSRDPEA